MSFIDFTSKKEEETYGTPLYVYTPRNLRSAFLNVTNRRTSPLPA